MYQSATGRQSHNTFNSDELRPLTSVTASWETLSHLHVDQAIEHPENNLWIIEADDPNLDSQIVNAIVHGMYATVDNIWKNSCDSRVKYTQFDVSKTLLLVLWMNSRQVNEKWKEFCLVTCIGMLALNWEQRGIRGKFNC